MFERLMELHKAGKITHAKIDLAVSLGWITEAQGETIKTSGDVVATPVVQNESETTAS